MTDEPPVRSGRPTSGAASRLADLLSEFERAHGNGTAHDDRPDVRPDDVRAGNGDGATPAGVAALAALRARVAALGPDDEVQTAPPEGPRAGQAPVQPEAATTDAEDLPYAPAASGGARRGRPSRVLVIGMAFLIVAIPVLAVVGARTVLDSRAGKVTERNLDPTAPGYVAIVEPTPTALVIQRDFAGNPTSMTLLSLGTGEAGGSVLFIPLDTNLLTPALYVDRIRTTFADGRGIPSMVSVTGKLLRIGFENVVLVGDADWAQMVAPVSPLHLDNPTELTVGDTVLPAGPIDLQADQVAAYLAASAPDQDDLDRLQRQQLVWRTWLDAIAAAGPTDAVPTLTNGLGPFIKALASGATSMATLSVVPAAVQAPDGANAFDADQAAIVEQLTDAVPAPISPGLGTRFTARVVNGYNGEPIPNELIRELVKAGAQIEALGNATEFGARETTIEYRSEKRKSTAEAVRDLLGGGKIRFDAETNDPVDLVIVLGRDALEGFAGD